MVMHDPTPILVACTACSWRRVINGRGDALVAGINHFTHCPDCGQPVTHTRRAEPGVMNRLKFQVLLATTPSVTPLDMAKHQRKAADEDLS